MKQISLSINMKAWMQHITAATIIVAAMLLMSCPVSAQSVNDEIEGFTKVKELIKSNSDQATNEVDQLLKGKNKKNPGLLADIGLAYLEAGKVTEAKEYASLARKADAKSSSVYILEGDIALAEKNVGKACQLYEQAIYFNPECKEAYLKYANAYKNASPQLAIEKLVELKKLDPSNIQADQALADVYYSNNQFDKAVEAYSKFIDSPESTENDITKYAFALFLDHKFEKSLDVVQKGLVRNPRNATFNRLAMYNNADLKRYEEGLQAADKFFNASDKPDFAYLDYLYYGHLLNSTKQYDAAIEQYQKAMKADSKKDNLWREISEVYENKGDYDQAIDSYKKFYSALSADKQTVDLQLELGKLYYAKGTSTDNPEITDEQKQTALKEADAIFADVANKVPDNYLGNFWRARVNSALDPETTEGLAKPYYETVISMLNNKNEARYNSILVECYSYLGYYYLVANKLPESKEYWQKILEIAPENPTALKALEGIKG